MLDAFKKSQPTREQADELRALIAASKEERAALSTMITQMQMQGAKLSAASRSAHDLERQTEAIVARLEEAVEQARTLVAALQAVRQTAAPAEGPATKTRRPSAARKSR